MIGSVSSAATTAVSTTSSSSSSSELASLKSQLAAKQSELDQAETEEDQSTINDEITALKSEIAALKTSGGQTEKTGSETAKTTPSGEASDFATADKAAPEGRMKSAAMDVLMKLGPQGGMMHPGGMNMAGGPPDVSQLYSEMDADSDGSVTEDEFVSGRPDRMSEDDATKLYSALDTEDTGAITEEQLAQSMQPPGRPNGPPPGGMFPPADGRMMGEPSDTAIAA